MRYKWVCLECWAEFNEPAVHEETHGMDTLPFEVMYTCPICCSEYYAPAVYCDLCDYVILDDYIITNDDSYICNHCYSKRNVGD